MEVNRIVDEIRKKYPGKTIILDSQKNPTEIICEAEPTEDHPERSVALAIVGKSKSHYHKKSKEIYETVKGVLTVYVDSKKYVLKEGEKLVVEPNTVHCVEGSEVWFLIYSEPGWTQEDHIVADGQ